MDGEYRPELAIPRTDGGPPLEGRVEPLEDGHRLVFELPDGREFALEERWTEHGVAQVALLDGRVVGTQTPLPPELLDELS